MVAGPNASALRSAKTTNLLRVRVMNVRLCAVECGGVWHWHVTEILLRCAGPRRIVGAVTEPHAVRRLLAAFGLAAEPPPRRPSPPYDLRVIAPTPAAAVPVCPPTVGAGSHRRLPESVPACSGPCRAGLPRPPWEYARWADGGIRAGKGNRLCAA